MSNVTQTGLRMCIQFSKKKEKLLFDMYIHSDGQHQPEWLIDQQ